MKIARIILNPLIFLVMSILYLYLLFYSSFNSVKIEKFVDSVDFQVLYDELDDQTKAFLNYSTFKGIAADAVIGILEGREFDSSKIIELIDSELSIILDNPNVEESLKEEIRTNAYMQVNEIKESVDEVASSENVKLIQMIYEIFSSKTLKIVLVAFAVVLICFLILNPKFKWVKYNGVIMGFMTISYFVALVIVNKILALAGNEVPINIIKSCFNVLFESSFYICIYFMVTSLVSLIIYKFGLVRLVKKKA